MPANDWVYPWERPDLYPGWANRGNPQGRGGTPAWTSSAPPQPSLSGRGSTPVASSLPARSSVRMPWDTASPWGAGQRGRNVDLRWSQGAAQPELERLASFSGQRPEEFFADFGAATPRGEGSLGRTSLLPRFR